MQVAFQWLVDVCGWILEGAHLSDHGEDCWEWILGSWVEGDIEHLGFIND